MSPARRRLVGGLDLGGTKIQAVLLDGRRNVVADAKQATPAEGDGDDVVAALASTLAEVCEKAGVASADLAGVGVGSPGAIDGRRGVVSGARNLPGEGAPIRMVAGLKKLAGTPAYLDNDVTVGVHAEYELGAAKKAKGLLGVWWGTGVGGGLVLDGKKWEGRGAAGELGHIVVKIGGALCTCGRHGCLEAYAGRGAMEIKARHLHKNGHKTHLFKIMKERERTRLQSGVWARALEREDEMAVHLIDRAIEALGAGIASAVNLLDVSSVVVGGGLGTRLGEPYVARIREAMQPHLFVDENPPDVACAALGDLGGAIGAALLVPPGSARSPRRRARRIRARGPAARAGACGPVQQHALVARAQREQFADLLRAEALHVAEGHHEALALREAGQGLRRQAGVVPGARAEAQGPSGASDPRRARTGPPRPGPRAPRTVSGGAHARPVCAPC